jgi:hypothetical protein
MNDTALTSPLQATVYTQVGCKVGAEDFQEAKTVDNPILIHAAMIPGKAFGDPRLVKRGLHYMRQCESTNR